MFPAFLPASVKHLTEPASIQTLEALQRKSIATPLSQEPISTAYINQGSGGTPILLLHGFDSSLLEFRLLLPLLAQQVETWSVDLLGFGFTDRQPKLSYTPATIKTHLYHFWKALIDRPIILVGASMGGATAIDFTLTYPDSVERLVLIDSLGYTSSPAFVQYLFPPFDVLAVEYLRQRKLKALELCSAIGADSSLIDLLRCSVLHTEMPRWAEATIAFTKSGGYSLKEHISRIAKPTLILWGESDDVLGTADAQRFKQDITGSRLIWIQNCKHVPAIEQPQITAQHILEFSCPNFN